MPIGTPQSTLLTSSKQFWCGIYA